MILRLLAPHPGRVALAGVLGLAFGAAGWAVALYLQKALDGGATPSLTAALLAVCLSRAAVGVARRAVQLGLVRTIEHDLARAYVRRALGSTVPPADLLSRLKGLEHLRIAIEDRVLGVFFDAVVFAIAGVVLFTVSPPLALLALTGALLPALVVGFVRRSIQQSFERTQTANADLARRALDAFEGARDLRLFNATDWGGKAVDETHDRSQHLRQRHHIRLALIGAATTLLSTFASVILLHVGSGLVASHALTPGELIFIYSMAGSMLGPLENVVISWIFFEEARVALLRQASVEVDRVPRDSAEDGAIRFDVVSFAYQQGLVVLRDIVLRIAPGETVAIVGESGAGKSTLLALVAGLIAPIRGKVGVGGAVAALLHDPHLFEATVRDNITLGGAFTEVEVRQAISAACADFVFAWPEGLDARLGPGVRLSAGQRQRLALARALIRRPRILLLDEATANLDVETEEALWRNLDAGRAGRTTLVVTHRLRTAARADRIVVLTDGTLAEQGSFRDLIERRGAFHNLWQRQTAMEEAVPHDV